MDACYLVFVYFFYPETKKLTLEEVAKIFDGKDAKVGRMDLGEVKYVGKDETQVMEKQL